MKRITIKDIPQKKVHATVFYNPLTGIFKRKKGIPGQSSGSIIGWKRKDGYMSTKIDNITIGLSRLAFIYMLGYLPEHEAEHKNRIRHDNRWSNLREATHSCNMKNKNIAKNNKSGVIGVSWYKTTNKWLAAIRHNDKQLNLGYYKNKIDAVKARWKAEQKYNWSTCCTTSSAYKYLTGEKQWQK